MVEKARKIFARMWEVRAVLEHPSLYPTTLALFAAFHLLLLGLRMHELALSSEFIVIAAACRTFPLLPISRHIRFLRFLVSAVLSILSAISALAESYVHNWKDIFAGLQQHWLAVVLLAFLSLAAEKVAEARHGNRLKTIIPMGVKVLHGEQEALFELTLKDPSLSVINVRVTSHQSTPLYGAEVRDTNNRFTIFYLNCGADLATCELPLEKGRYLISVKKLNALEPPMRVTVHAIVLPLSTSDPKPQVVPLFPDPTSQSPTRGRVKNKVHKVPTYVGNPRGNHSMNLHDSLGSPESLAQIARTINISSNNEADARRRAEEDGVYS
jgi:hypothetical protein